MKQELETAKFQESPGFSRGEYVKKMELPRELLSVLDVSKADLGQKLKILIALELVREGRISTGKGAELLGVSKADFIQVLSEQGIPYFNETADELTEQITTISPLLDKLQS